MSFPSPITALKLRVSAGTAPNVQTFEQLIPSATMGSNSMQIMPNTTVFNAFNSHPFGTSFTPSIVTSYGSDESGNGLSVVSTPSVLPNFTTKNTPNLSLATLLSNLTIGSTFSLSVTSNSTGVLSYESSAVGVATVNSSGLVTIVGAGPTTITVSLEASSDGLYAAASVSRQLVVPLITLAANGVTIQYNATVGDIPSSTPLFVQANPRGAPQPEWFAVVTDDSRSQITSYANNEPTGITYFTPLDQTSPVIFNNIVTTLITDMTSTFSGAALFNHPISSWDTSNVTNMAFMFEDAALFDQPIGGWNTELVFNMSGMFKGASAFDQPIGGWNTSNVTVMSFMFTYAALFNQLIDEWDTSSVTDMAYMFNDAVLFNQPIGGWNTELVTNMNAMFKGASAFDQPIGEWVTSSVTNMNAIFYGASAFNQDISLWDISNVTDISVMFADAISFNQPVGEWDTSAATDMSYMFYGAEAFDQDISKWNTTNVTDMYAMFDNAIVFNQPLGKWNTSNVTDMGFMFYNCTSFDKDIGSWDTSSVTTMLGMFLGCNVFNQPVGRWNTSNVTDMESMFESCWLFDQDISSWDTSNVIYMPYMFYEAFKFNQDISLWDTSNVIDMSYTFFYADKFNYDISSWVTSNVTDMSYMFSYAATFNKPIGGWNTTNVTNMAGMFVNATTFDQPIGRWDTTNVTNMSYMFYDARNFNQHIRSWNVTHLSEPNNFSTNSNLSVLNTPNWNGQPTHTVILDSVNGNTMRWTGPNVPSPYFVQANPRGTPQPEWFAIVDNTSKSQITSYATSGTSTYFTSVDSGLIPFNNIVTTLMTNMSSIFYDARTFDHPIGSWDTMNVTNMHSMFENAEEFDQDIGKWMTRNVTDMSYMFYYAQSFERDIGKWMTMNVTDMSYMFYEASKFNIALNRWKTRNVTNMSHMFHGASLYNQDISPWDVSFVTNMSHMFHGASLYNQDISPWDTRNVEDMSYMFHNALNFNQYLGNLKVQHLSEPDNFSTGSNLSVLNKPNWGGEPIDTVILDVNGLTLKWTGFTVPSPYLVQANPRGTPQLEWFAIVNDSTRSNITDYAKSTGSAVSAYFTPPDAQSPIPFNNIVTTLVTDMNSMFYGASTFDHPIGSWDTKNVRNMRNMFNGASVFNQNISGWNIMNVTDTRNMFYGANIFNLNQDISSWNTTNMINSYSSMFANFMYKAYIKNTSDYNDGDESYDTIQEVDEDQFTISLITPFIIDSLSFNTIYIHSNGSIHFKQASTTYTYPYPWNYFALFCFGADLNVIENDFIRYKEIDNKFVIIYNCRYYINEDVVDATYASAQFQVKITLHLESSTNSGMITMDFGTTNSIPVPTLLGTSFGSKIESYLNTNINFLDHPESEPYIFNYTNTPLQEIQDMQSGYSNKQLVIRPVQ